MLVTTENFHRVIERLQAPGLYGLDTETFGLRRDDRLFSIILADATDAFYFNFLEYFEDDRPLWRSMIAQMQPIFSNPYSTFAIHNAKFDLQKLAMEGIELRGAVYCTEAMERVLRNNYLPGSYNLAACAKRRGWEKDSAVEKYIKENKLITKLPNGDERWHFDQVPFEIMSKYAEQDAKLHRAICLDQKRQFAEMVTGAPAKAPPLAPLIENEQKLTKACFRIEETGIRVNRDYVRQALAYTRQVATSAMQDFERMTGIPYEDSATTLAKAFSNSGIELPKTKTGKPCTNKQVLNALVNPVADKIREIRGAQKLCSTYYENFLYFADDRDLIHASMRQGGTETHRFSYSDPNLQNLPKEDEDSTLPYYVRRCFVPLDPDWLLVPIDFKQQEFRLMLDYAGERELIALVLTGMDLHEATAQLLGVTRKQAKTLNFGLLYGMGVAKLAAALKISEMEARQLRYLYFAKLPRVRVFIDQVMRMVVQRGYVWNWHGFRCHLPTAPGFEYIIPNHVIQGGGAEVVRVAMVRIDEFLEKNGYRSRMLAQVHDEILFQIHRSEIHIIPELKRIMEGVYKPLNGMILECSVEHSALSWCKWDMTKGEPLAA